MADYFEQMEALAAGQGGYFYPWRSCLDPGDGEAAYTAAVEARLAPGLTVVEAGCGHGPDISRFAPRVAHYIAYDAVAGFIAVAREGVARAGLSNVRLAVANSAPRHNGGRARMPAGDACAELVISRRGPTNWIADAPRVVRPGGRLIQLNPLPSPPPPWNAALPDGLRLAPEADDVVDRIGALLADAGVRLERADVFDVAETFDTASDLYRRLAWLRDEAPPFEAARGALDAVLAAEGGRAALRHRRYLWTAVI